MKTAAILIGIALLGLAVSYGLLLLGEPQTVWLWGLFR